MVPGFNHNATSEPSDLQYMPAYGQSKATLLAKVVVRKKAVIKDTHFKLPPYIGLYVGP